MEGKLGPLGDFDDLTVRDLLASGKIASPEQVAEVVVRLADRTGRNRSGDVLLVDAGPSVTLMP